MNLARQFAQPAQFGAKVLDHQTHHPNRFVETVADLLPNGAQNLLFPGQLFLQKSLPPAQLLLEDAGASLPR